MSEKCWERRMLTVSMSERRRDHCQLPGKGAFVVVVVVVVVSSLECKKKAHATNNDCSARVNSELQSYLLTLSSLLRPSLRNPAAAQAGPNEYETPVTRNPQYVYSSSNRVEEANSDANDNSNNDSFLVDANNNDDNDGKDDNVDRMATLKKLYYESAAILPRLEQADIMELLEDENADADEDEAKMRAAAVLAKEGGKESSSSSSSSSSAAAAAAATTPTAASAALATPPSSSSQLVEADENGFEQSLSLAIYASLAANKRAAAAAAVNTSTKV